MRRHITVKEDYYLDGQLTLVAGRNYLVHVNGTSKLDREFVLSDVTG